MAARNTIKDLDRLQRAIGRLLAEREAREALDRFWQSNGLKAQLKLIRAGWYFLKLCAQAPWEEISEKKWRLAAACLAMPFVLAVATIAWQFLAGNIVEFIWPGSTVKKKKEAVADGKSQDDILETLDHQEDKTRLGGVRGEDDVPQILAQLLTIDMALYVQAGRWAILECIGWAGS